MDYARWFPILYSDAVALTNNFVFVRWLVGVREQVRILISAIKFNPKDTKKSPRLFTTIKQFSSYK